METVWAIIAAFGLPTALLGLLIRRLEKKIDEEKKAREEQAYQELEKGGNR